MFYGYFNHTLDPKGRTSLPAKFRETLAQEGEPKIFLVQDPRRRALRALPLSLWKKVEERVMRVSPLDDRAQRSILRFVSSAQEIDLDEHGRVLVPQSLRNYAALQKDVVWAGMGRDITLWDKALYEEEMARTMAPEEVVDFFSDEKV